MVTVPVMNLVVTKLGAASALLSWHRPDVKTRRHGDKQKIPAIEVE